MIETIEVANREARGTRAMIKIRESGSIPAILYGHGEDNVCLTVSLDTINKLIKHGTKLVNLTGAVTDSALLKSVQWSSMGDYIIHVDFARVSQSEAVDVTLPVHLAGEAPGALTAAGQLRFVTHQVTIRCPASNIPEFLVYLDRESRFARFHDSSKLNKRACHKQILSEPIVCGGLYEWLLSRKSGNICHTLQKEQQI